MANSDAEGSAGVVQQRKRSGLACDSDVRPRLGHLRIAAVDPERNFGGGEAQVIGLTLELLRAGHHVELLCDPEGELWPRATAGGITCRPLTIRNSLDAIAGLRLRSMLGRKPFDVVHFHTARAHAMAPYVWGRASAMVVTRRMDYVPNRLFAPWLYNRAVDGVAAISEGVAQALVRGGVARRRIAIIPSGIDCLRFAPPSQAMRQRARSALGLRPEDIALGAIGALVVRKGHRVLVDAMALARHQDIVGGATEEARDRLRCFIAGTGPLQDDLLRRIQQADLRRSVRLLGPLENPALLLAALDFFVMPSLNEGMGVAALEAMAVGLPVIASAVGGLPEVVCDGHTGLLVNPGDARVLARAMVRLATETELRSAMGLAARQSAAENFTTELMGQRTLKLYEACLLHRRESMRKRAGAVQPTY